MQISDAVPKKTWRKKKKTHGKGNARWLIAIELAELEDIGRGKVRMNKAFGTRFTSSLSCSS